MKKKIKWLLTAICAFALTVGAAACGSGSTDNGSDSNTPPISSDTGSTDTGSTDSGSTDSSGEEKDAIVLNEKAISLSQEKTFQLTATTELTETGVWSSDNDAIATVSDDGLVTAISQGLARITYTIGEESVTCVVTVTAYQPEGKLVLSASKDSVTLLETGEYSVSVSLKEGDKEVSGDGYTWTSDDLSIATVTDGTITAVKAGKTTVKVSTTYKGIAVTAEIAVEVLPLDMNIVFELTNMEIKKDQEVALSTLDVYAVQGETVVELSEANISWEVADENIALISDGKLIGVAKGNVDVTVTAAIGDKSISTVNTIRVREEYTVSFQSEGEEITSETVLDGEQVEETTMIPTLKGYTFSAWAKDGEIYDFESEIQSDTILTPRWLKFMPVVRYDKGTQGITLDWTGNLGNKIEYNGSIQGYDGYGATIVKVAQYSKYPTSPASVTMASLNIAQYGTVAFYVKPVGAKSAFSIAGQSSSVALEADVWTEIRIEAIEGGLANVYVADVELYSMIGLANMNEKAFCFANGSGVQDTKMDICLSAVYANVDYQAALRALDETLPTVTDSTTFEEVKSSYAAMNDYLTYMESCLTPYEQSTMQLSEKAQALKAILAQGASEIFVFGSKTDVSVINSDGSDYLDEGRISFGSDGQNDTIPNRNRIQLQLQENDTFGDYRYFIAMPTLKFNRYSKVDFTFYYNYSASISYGENTIGTVNRGVLTISVKTIEGKSYIYIGESQICEIDEEVANGKEALTLCVTRGSADTYAQFKLYSIIGQF